MMVNILARMLGLDNPAEPNKEKKEEREMRLPRRPRRRPQRDSRMMRDMRRRPEPRESKPEPETEVSEE